MTTPGFKRKLSAVFMADVVGYSSLMGADEAATLATLTTYQGIMDGLIRQHRGRVVDAPGDAVLAEFSSVVDAVQCAVAVQKELAARNDELPENRRMQFRIGINLGDVIEEGDKLFGDGVNIAARLEALADPGGICISKTAFDHIETKLPLGYEFLGEKPLKNIVKPVGAYRVLLEPRVTVAGETVPQKGRPGLSRTALAAGVLVLALAAISVVLWQSGRFAAPPAKETDHPGPQTPEPMPVQPPASTPSAATSPPTVSKPQESPASPTALQPPRNKLLQLMKQIDRNGDGKITLDEFMTFRLTRFDYLDANKDGYLSRAELGAGKITFARKLLENFALIDTNHDQKLSREEFREATKLFFFRLDTSRDGNLSQDELVAARFGED